MSVESDRIVTRGPNPDPLSAAQTPRIMSTGSAEALGGGAYLTAAHLFKEEIGDRLYVADSQELDPTRDAPGVPLSSPVYIGDKPFDPQTLQYDLAVTVAPGLPQYPSPSTLTPLIAFADQTAASNFLQRNSSLSLSSFGPGSGGSGSFSAVTEDQQFESSVPAGPGDSGGAVYVTPDSSQTQYIVGILSGSPEVPSGQLTSSPSISDYLSTDSYYRAVSVIPKGTDFQGLAPDLLIGNDANEYIRGSSRKADIIINGDHTIIGAGPAGDLINTGIGKDDIIFMPTALGDEDPGTTVVVSPGTKTIVGGGANDKLVVPVDRLWSRGTGWTPQADLSDVTDTIQLTGGYRVQFGIPRSDDVKGPPIPIIPPPDEVAGEMSTVVSQIISTPPYFANRLISDYSYGVDYRFDPIEKDLLVRFTADSLDTNDPDWSSTIVIEDYHPGDFGLNFSLIGDPNHIYTSSEFADLHEQGDNQYIRPPSEEQYVDDPSQDWIGIYGDDDFIGASSGQIAAGKESFRLQDLQPPYMPTPPAPQEPGNLLVADDDQTASIPAGSTATVTGNRDTIIALGSDSNINVSGLRDTSYITNGTVVFAGGSSESVSGNNNDVALQSNLEVVVEGVNNRIAISGMGNNVQLTAASLSFSDSSGGLVIGNGNAITLGASDCVSTSGEGDIALVNGAHSTLEMLGDTPTANVVGTDARIVIENGTVNFWDNAGGAVVGDDNSITLNANDTVSVSGADETVYLQAAGETLSISGATVYAFNDAGATVTGDGNTFEVFANDALTVNGDNNTVSIHDAGSSVTATGSGNSVIVGATNATVSATSGMVEFDNDASGSVAGDEATLKLFANATVTATGAGDTAYLQDVGEILTISGATVYAFNNAGATVTGDGNTFEVFANDSLIVHGDSNTVSVHDTGSSVTATGVGNSVIVGATAAAVTAVSGSVEFDDHASGSVAGDGATLKLFADTAVTATGSGDIAYLQAAGETLSIGGATVYAFNNASATVTGNGNTFEVFANDALTVNGTNNAIRFDDTGSTVVMSGSDASVAQQANGNLRLTGISTDAVSVANGHAKINLGGGNTVATIGVPGEVDGFDASGHQQWAELYDKMSGALNETDSYAYNASNALTEVDKRNGAGTLTQSDLYSPTRAIEVGSYLYSPPGTVTEVVDLVANHDWLRGANGTYTDRTTGATSSSQPVLNNS